MHTKIEQLLTDKKYTTPLKLIVEECDKEKLKAQEEVRKDWSFPEQKKTFTQMAMGKKKGIFLIRLICTHVVVYRKSICLIIHEFLTSPKL